MTGLKVFSATKAKERETLGERVTDWLRDNPKLDVTDKQVRLSSDKEYHCLSIIVAYVGGVDKQPKRMRARGQ